MHYQPVVHFETSEVMGFEALVRWEHPDHGLMPPDEFLPIAEQTGLIVPIGAWVLQEACAQASRWSVESAGDAALTVGVNLSARQLLDPDIVTLVESALAAASLDPSLLVLEITETALTDNRDHALAVLHQIASIGVQVGIDDFGTGHSSLRAPQGAADSHVEDRQRRWSPSLGKDPEDAAIVAALVNLGHALGFTVTAEGIENATQLNELRALGCDFGQGYYFARPQPAEVVRALVHHRFRWSGRPSAPRNSRARRSRHYRCRMSPLRDRRFVRCWPAKPSTASGVGALLMPSGATPPTSSTRTRRRSRCCRSRGRFRPRSRSARGHSRRPVRTQARADRRRHVRRSDRARAGVLVVVLAARRPRRVCRGHAQRERATFTALAPRLVGDDQLLRANALLGAASMSAIAFGPLIAAGAISLWGIRATFLVDAVTYLIGNGGPSCRCTCAGQAESPERPSVLHELRAGFAVVRDRAVVRRILGLSVTVYMVWGAVRRHRAALRARRVAPFTGNACALASRLRRPAARKRTVGRALSATGPCPCARCASRTAKRGRCAVLRRDHVGRGRVLRGRGLGCGHRLAHRAV